jgi:hypothetical protein
MDEWIGKRVRLVDESGEDYRSPRFFGRCGVVERTEVGYSADLLLYVLFDGEDYQRGFFAWRFEVIGADKRNEPLPLPG